MRSPATINRLLKSGLLAGPQRNIRCAQAFQFMLMAVACRAQQSGVMRGMD
jgi:hypothetical protein